MSDPKSRQKETVLVAAVTDLPPGERKIVEVGGRSVGVFNVNGEFKAVLNLCPHELAPICKGRVDGTTLPSSVSEFRWGREGEILFCPWHGWEFDLISGPCLTDPRKRLHFFPVSVEDGQIYVTV